MRSLPTLALLGLLSSLATSAPAQTVEFDYVHGGVVMRAEATDDLNVWTTHTGGVIRYSSDAGATFTNAVVPKTVTGTLRGIQVSSDGQGPFAYCVGADGVLLFSTDGGITWTQKPVVMNLIPTPANLWDVLFEDRDHGWVVGFDHVILETTDGGMNWTNVAPSGHIAAQNPEWYQIQEIGPDEWIAVADNGWYIRHLPGGAMPHAQIFLGSACYSPQLSNPPWDLELWAVDFAGDYGLIGAGVGHNDGYVFESLDRGATWSLHTGHYDHLSATAGGNTPPTFYGVELWDDSTKGAVAGYGSSVYLSGMSSTSTAVTGCTQIPGSTLALTQVVSDSDANMTFEVTDDGAKPLLRDISAAPSNLIGWAVGDFGHVRSSTDEGATWVEHAGLHRGRLNGGEFADMQTGVVFGQVWRAYWTTDGGQNFTREYVPTVPIDPNTGKQYSGNFNAGAITAGGAQAVVVGDRGRVATRDSAGVWTDRSIGAWATPLTLTAVDVSSNASVILTVGTAGSIYYSTDSGATFTQYALTSSGTPVTANIKDMVIEGNLVFYLCADQQIYIALVSNFANAFAALPFIGATGTPSAMNVKSSNVYAGNDAGQVFQLNRNTGQMELVTAIAPADLGNKVFDVEFVPGSTEWFIGGDQGKVQYFDGSTWGPAKSTFEREVRSLEFFSSTEGLVIGRKTSIGTW